jgi:hypothetical protein
MEETVEEMRPRYGADWCEETVSVLTSRTPWNS